ncbi:uncharacterized protein Z518_02102 [Rhinocladiella mackenziei CBS 650.93]|uniref:Carboxypeptidase n=1 Tax=Rhinocladiella mackenziei CBS 650.93 TaxID=1442369 RepID=A0A0D2INS7_9EURO|nr:uncharacterized protein Z518_02102 [Rhinocladiella mackenziei CBS 650.93]KIX07449.1 hypothetical protein Z518_02102 [Rhinocladiella mackenziei CBS 650.93]
MKIASFALGTAALASLASAQFQPTPSGITVATSKVNKEVKISYKEIEICETAPGVHSYSGYVHIPGSLVGRLGGYDMNVYFMYFEARKNPKTAPLAVYLAGGPGEASSYAALNSESGPCYVNHEGTNTTINPWSFSNHVNMLYIDQPIEVGFSYSSLINGTYNTTSLLVTPDNANSTSLPPGYGTFSDQAASTTANTTVASARGLWVFAEHWFSSFPGYDTSSNDISFWGNSYGGFYVPEVAATVSKQLKKLTTSHPLRQKDLKVDAIGITNGCVDFYYQMEGFPEYANNNTYGVKFYNDTTYREIQNNITKPGGCLDMTKQCRHAGEVGDPDYTGNNATVNEICTDAYYYCASCIELLYTIHNVSTYDIAIETPGTCAYYLTVGEYLNKPDVQSALGVPLNWTWYSNEVASAFTGLAGTGDAFRQSNLPNLEYLLNEGVKTALIYGDRDYTCPVTGAEMLAKAVPWKNRKGFADAGYQELKGLSQSAKGGVAKQYGRLSFTRVFESGHQVSAYAPEAVFTIFDRTIFNKDVVTGGKGVGPDYHTTGPKESSGWKSKLPGPFQDVCMVEGNFSSSRSFAAPDW